MTTHQANQINYIEQNYPRFNPNDERLKNALALKVLIRTWNGGQYGRYGYELKLVQPRKFKNGKLKTRDYHTIIEKLTDIDDEYPFEFSRVDGYNYRNHAKSESIIYRVIEYFDGEKHHSLKGER